MRPDNLARRRFLQGLASTAIVAFNPLRRSWVTEASARLGDCAVPRLDGQLLTDATTLDAFGDDFGHVVHQRPVAVLKPGSVEDIVKMVRFARRLGIKVAMRGQGHSTFGQSQAQGGLVIDSSTLATVHEAGPGGILVDVGARWRQVLDVCLPAGVTPPTLPDYLDLTVGGNLSVGGVDGASHRTGAVIDNVLELLVVTGEGELVRCSPNRNADLFQSVLGGLGQFGLIVRARLAAVPAPAMVRKYTLRYANLPTMLQDMHTLALDERFNHLECEAQGGDPKGAWAFSALCAAWFSPPSVPDDAELLAGLQFTGDPSLVEKEDVTYRAYLERIDAQIEMLKMFGIWAWKHVWYDTFIPHTTAGEHIGDTLAEESATDVFGPILIYPMRRSKLKRPFFRVPDEEVFYLFDLLRSVPPDVPGLDDAYIAKNRQIYDDAVSLGGVKYCIGTIPFSQADWQLHFGTAWSAFVKAKKRFDPDGVLTPGQGIFG